MEPDNVKGHLRAGKSLFLLGRMTESRMAYGRALAKDGGLKAARDELAAVDAVDGVAAEAQRLLEGEKWAPSLRLWEQVLSKCPHAERWRHQRLRALLGMGRNAEVAREAGLLAQGNRNDVHALFLRGRALLNMGQTGTAGDFFKECLRIDPDYAEARVARKAARAMDAAKEAGNAHFKAGRQAEAVAAYTEALEVDAAATAFNAVVLCNRAGAYLKMTGSTDERTAHAEKAAQDASRALKLDPSYVKAFQRRAAAHQALEEWDEAVRDLDQASQLEPRNAALAQSLRSAKLEAKKAKRKDYYKVLGCAKTATEHEIKKAYRKASLKWHPDRNNESEESRERATKMMHDVNMARDILMDAEKRRRYDQGAVRRVASPPLYTISMLTLWGRTRTRLSRAGATMVITGAAACTASPTWQISSQCSAAAAAAAALAVAAAAASTLDDKRRGFRFILGRPLPRGGRQSPGGSSGAPSGGPSCPIGPRG